MTKRNFAGLSIIVLLIAAGCTREGPMGPPGTAGLGAVEGVVTVWEDIAWNSKNSSVDPAGVTVVLEGTEFSATTDDFGAYKIEAIPAGVYVIVAFKDSASAEGFGTVKQTNFFVGGGTSHFSIDVARKAKPPTEIEVGTLGLEGEPGVIVTWTPYDPNLSHRYTVWYASDPSFERKSSVVTREGTLAFIPSYMLPEGETIYFAVTADNGMSYVDKATGSVVAPTTSVLSGPSEGIQVPAGMPIANYFSAVAGAITSWDDVYAHSADPSGVTVVLETTDIWSETLDMEETEYRATTNEGGLYFIADVPVGLYSITASKEGYGTVRRYNLFVGRGVSYFSADIARKADAPVNVQADSTTLEGQSGIRVSWDAPDSGRHHYFVWCAADTSSGEAMVLGNTSGSSVFVLYEGLPEGTRYFGVASDNDISYLDEKTGQFVFPTRSETKWASNAVEIPG